MLKYEEMLWFQTSREKWITVRDHNTKFFQATTLLHRRRNKVEGLKLDNEEQCFDAQILEMKVVKFFFNFFWQDGANTQYDLPYDLFPCLNQVD